MIFNLISLHDLTVRNGRIDYHQGYPSGFQSELEAKRQAARNKFSLKGEPQTLEHDIHVDMNSQGHMHISMHHFTNQIPTLQI